MNAGHVDGDAVHLAFDEEGEVEGADVGLGFVEIEEDLALGVEGGLGGVEVLGDVAALFVLRVEGAGGEGDGLALLVGDGEGDALAEAGVELALAIRRPAPLAQKRPLARRTSSVKCGASCSRMWLKSSGA